MKTSVVKSWYLFLLAGFIVCIYFLINDIESVEKVLLAPDVIIEGNNTYTIYIGWFDENNISKNWNDNCTTKDGFSLLNETLCNQVHSLIHEIDAVVFLLLVYGLMALGIPFLQCLLQCITDPHDDIPVVLNLTLQFQSALLDGCSRLTNPGLVGRIRRLGLRKRGEVR